MRQPRWLRLVRNRCKFFDHLHATVIPYVDLFITHDQDFIKKLAWYDQNVLVPRGIATYGQKVHGSGDTIEEQLAQDVETKAG